MRHVMQFSGLGAGARLRPPNVRAMLAVVAGTCALLAYEGPAPAGGKREAEDSKLSTRRHRWWMDGWAHSMQELCFIVWMDQLDGGTGWRHSMQESDVEWVYAWWSVAIWTPPESRSAD